MEPVALGQLDVARNAGQLVVDVRDRTQTRLVRCPGRN